MPDTLRTDQHARITYGISALCRYVKAGPPGPDSTARGGRPLVVLVVEEEEEEADDNVK